MEITDHFKGRLMQTKISELVEFKTIKIGDFICTNEAIDPLLYVEVIGYVKKGKKIKDWTADQDYVKVKNFRNHNSMIKMPEYVYKLI